MKVTMIHGAKSWMSSPTHPNYAAAAKAIEKVFGCTPDYTREGGSIPITTAMEEATGMNVLLLPVGACDDMAHSQNEKYNVSNLMNGKFSNSQVFHLVHFELNPFLPTSASFPSFRSLIYPIELLNDRDQGTWPLSTRTRADQGTQALELSVRSADGRRADGPRRFRQGLSVQVRDVGCCANRKNLIGACTSYLFKTLDSSGGDK
jgi:hypothetical protein